MIAQTKSRAKFELVLNPQKHPNKGKGGRKRGKIRRTRIRWQSYLKTLCPKDQAITQPPIIWGEYWREIWTACYKDIVTTRTNSHVKKSHIKGLDFTGIRLLSLIVLSQGISIWDGKVKPRHFPLKNMPKNIIYTALYVCSENALRAVLLDSDGWESSIR